MNATKSPLPPCSIAYRWGIGLALFLASLLLLNNWQYLFHTPLYENSDWAADSLLVRDAKHQVVLHGHYSRWGFYHPGPVLLYTYALGEVIFYDVLHIVPTPYNGQVIGLGLVEALFFGLALAVFAHRLGAGRGGYAFFLPLAMLFAVWHYGASSIAPAFMETWPACTPILAFLCFVVVTASAASGGGTELPLVALTGGWLVHNHVAQPLFVVPMTLLAYGGLLTWCRRNVADARPPGWRDTVAAAWRAFPRAHLAAGSILALFLLPLVVDALHGSKSNFSHILTHMRQHHEPLHEFTRSLYYFLIYGSYAYYHPAEDFLGDYTAAGLLSFVALHWRAYLCWMAVLTLTPTLLVLTRRTEALVPTPGLPLTRRSTFIPWFGVMTLTAFVLTLFWGMKQNGQMFYFNSDFNYSIYYCAALGLAAAAAGFLQVVTAAPHLRLARTALSATLVAGAAVAALSDVSSFKSNAMAAPDASASAQTVTRAAAATLPPGSVCYLDCDPWTTWPTAIGAALQLDRLGYKVRVNDNWRIMFGEARTISCEPIDYAKPMVRWSVVPMARDPVRLARWPVLGGNAIDVAPLADLDPAGASIRFAANGNSAQFACFGWAPCAAGDWTWADQPQAMLQFCPLPLPPNHVGGVDLLINAWGFSTSKTTVAQRLETAFNGVALSTVPLPVTAGTGESVKVHIDAARWRDACVRGFAKVVFRFPDAKSPYEVGFSEDVRRLGGAFRTIEFQPAP